ncbi:MAG TPA: hypothetical protein VF179_12355 [Thermoanaerobaculia bacterium]|nr:hypothetical protein [Thermoanaerobaculia bacterium]
MRFHLAFLLPVLLALPASALEPYLVEDINPTHEPGGSVPADFVTLGDTALFQALDPATGYELWASDGTAAGTHLLADLVPGGGSGFPDPFAVTPRLYFFTVMENPEIPPTLWATDGTPEGTVGVTPPGVAVDAGAVWSPGDEALYFAATDELHGRELWRSDGTPGGTHRVADLLLGQSPSWPSGLEYFKGRVWFGALSQEEFSGALWRTDGTATRMFLEFDTMIPTPVETVGGRLLFVTSDRYGAQDLWSTDGTARKTAPLLRLRHSRSPGKLFAFARYGPHVFFVAEDLRWGQELWVTDGTAAGTRMLTSIVSRWPFRDQDRNLYLSYAPALVGSRLMFTVRDGERVELWATDGTPRGTGPVWSCPGDCPDVAALWPASGGLVYWVGEDADRGRELWATDGTSPGTRLVLDLCPGACSSGPADPFVVGDRLLFTADDGTHGRELWSTDGTSAGTVRVSDFGRDEPRGPQFALQGTVVGERLLFAADDVLHGTELWTADGIPGSPGGTALVRDLNLFELGGSYPAMLGALGSTAFFFADDGVHGYELWKSAGTEPGTSMVAELVPGEAPHGPPARPPVAELGGALFFIQNQTPNDAWLVRTDGTAAGTFRVTPEGVSLCCFSELAVAGGRIFFMAWDAEHGFELWATDGTAAGTGLVADIRPGGLLSSLPRDLTPFDGDLYFTVVEESGGNSLWRSDGTEAGTVRVSGADVLDAGLLAVHGGRLWFVATTRENGLAIWSSDGTPTGTALVVDVATGFQDFSFIPNLLVSLGDKLAFSGLGDGELEGLWVTDGTPGGTERIAPAWNPGTAWTVFQGRLFYTPVFHFEPFFQLIVTDGTEEGTRELGFPGTGFEPATSFAPLGDRLLFSTAGGRRLWETDGTTVSPVTAEGFEPFEGATLLSAGPRVFLRGYGPAVGVELWAVRPDSP